MKIDEKMLIKIQYKYILLEFIQQSHPEQRRLLSVPYFDKAPIAAAVHCSSADPHTLDRTGMLEI